MRAGKCFGLTNIMIFTIAILVLIGAIAYFHYTQGLFSATISAICACLAAVLAFSFHEVVIFSLLKGQIANYAHSIVLVALFALGYLILRVIFDNLIPGNVRFPLYVERAGGGVMGIIAGIFAAGILAIAAQAMPFGAGAPYARYELAEDRDVTVPTGGRDEDAKVREAVDEAEPGVLPEQGRGGMIIPVDDMVVNLVERLSTGALAGSQPLSEVHPAYLDELFAQRLGVQVGASRVAFNVAAQQQVSVQGVYSIDQIAQADSEFPQVRDRPIKGLEAPTRKPAGPNEVLLIVRTQFGRGADDKDNHVRFSPASIRLVAGGANHYPIGTIDEQGVLRVNLPDDFLILPADGTADLVYQIEREALGLPLAPTRAAAARAADEAAPAIADGVFLEAKRMGLVDLSGQAIESYPGALEKTVLRKRNIPAPKAPGAAAAAAPSPGAAPTGGAGSTAQPAADAPIAFDKADVSPNLFTNVNVAGEGDGEKTFPSGSATVRDGKIAKLEVNTTQTVELLSRGDYSLDEFYVPPGMKMVQIIGRAPSGGPVDPWTWADKLGQFELLDSNNNTYKPHGGWARVKGAQGSNRMVARYDAENPVNGIATEDGVPTDVWIAFLVPEGTQLTELHHDAKVVAAVNQKVE